MFVNVHFFLEYESMLKFGLLQLPDTLSKFYWIPAGTVLHNLRKLTQLYFIWNKTPTKLKKTTTNRENKNNYIKVDNLNDKIYLIFSRNFSGLSGRLGKTPRMYYLGVHDNPLFIKLNKYNKFYDLLKCELDFIKVNDIP